MRILLNLFFISFFILSGLTVKCQENEQNKYNVLFIAIDDMNNWVGSFGGKAITPNIDALAKTGMKFTNAHCVVPACNPSRVALMTGQRPETTGQYTNAGNFREMQGGMDRITFPQFLQKQGYKTTSAGKIFHKQRGAKETPHPVSDPVSWDYQWKGNIGTQGHNLYLDENGWAKWLEGSHLDNVTNKGNSGMNYMAKFGVWGPIPHKKEETGDWIMSKYCADFLQQDHNDPFFLACGIFRPHSPQLAPQEYFDMFPLDKIELPEVPDDDMNDIPKIAQTNFSTPFVKLMREKGEWKKAVQGYLACMAYADDCVGLVMDALKKSKYAENTIVVLWTDHGWQLGHKNRWEKFSLWNQATNAPLIIYHPDMKTKNTTCDQAVSFLDIYPTMADLLGYKKPDYLDGQSLLPLLENPKSKRTTPAVVTYEPRNNAVVLGEWNYIHYENGEEELYNHKKDPQEFKNLAKIKKYKKVIKKLRKYLPETPEEHLTQK